MSDSSLLSSLRSSFMASQPVGGAVADPAGPSQATPIDSVSTDLTTDEQLAILGSVLDDIEARRPATDSVPSSPVTDVGAVAQVVPQVTLQSTNTLNPPQPVGTTLKESQSLSAVELAAVESGISLQAVEAEKSPELPPEVENFLQKVEEHQEQAPQEIVLAGVTAQAPATTHHPSQPVIVLPITPQLEKEGTRANIHWSMRWLVEWSHKVVKMFTGKVIYRQA